LGNDPSLDRLSFAVLFLLQPRAGL